MKYFWLPNADLRSLALLRIGISAIIITDVILRWIDLKAFYTNEGVLPASFINHPNLIFYSFQFINDSLLFHNFLFFLTVLSATLLLLGYKTRWVTFTTWVLLLSIQNRNYLLNYGADAIIALILFWGLFLPWEGRFSLDSLRYFTKGQRDTLTTLGTTAYFLQVSLIYLGTSLLKRSEIWISQGSGVYYALNIGQYQTSFGSFLLQFPVLLLILNYSVLFMEFLAPVVLFWPYKNYLIRTFAIFILISMHIGFGLGLTLELFSFVMMVMLLGLLPTWFWDKLNRISFKKSYQAILPRVFVLLRQRELKGSIPNYHLSSFQNFFILLMLIYAFSMAILSFIPVKKDYKLLQRININLQFSQDWSLFGPKPLDYSIWFITLGKLENGQVVDLATGINPVWNKPDNISDLYKDLRWKNFLFNAQRNKIPLQPYARYMCNEWNNKNLTKVRNVEVYSLIERNSFPKQKSPIEIKKEALYKCV